MANKEAVYKTYLWFLTCSNCGNPMADTDDEGTEIPTNFCPNCGAKIIGFEKETAEEMRELSLRYELYQKNKEDTQ